MGLNGVLRSGGSLGLGTLGAWAWDNALGNGTRVTVNVTAAGVHTFNLWMREDGVKVDQFILTKDANFVPTGGGGGGGGGGARVDLQAEAFTGQGAGSGAAAGHTWSQFSDAAAGGGLAVEATPNSGVNTGDGTIGPRLDYAINFTETGTYYVWVRSSGANGADDSYHVGLNGVLRSGRSLGMGSTGGWTWRNTLANGTRVTVVVSTTGVHTFNLWMREDGVKVDAITLTTDPLFVP